jgi:hypothetical protein
MRSAPDTATDRCVAVNTLEREIVKFGIRTPSFKKRIAARTSWKRVVRHNLGMKAPRGYGWITNPKRAAYNRVYNRTTVGLGKGCAVIVLAALSGVVGLVALVLNSLT